LEVVDRTGRRCEMQDVIERPFAMDEVGDVVFHERETVAAEKMLDVRGVAGDQIVHADHFVTAIEEQLAEIRPEETGAARDQPTSHSVLVPASNRNVSEALALHAL